MYTIINKINYSYHIPISRLSPLNSHTFLSDDIKNRKEKIKPTKLELSKTSKIPSPILGGKFTFFGRKSCGRTSVISIPKNVKQDPSDLCKHLCDFYHSILLHFAFNHSRYYYYKDSWNQNLYNTSSESVLVYM